MAAYFGVPEKMPSVFIKTYGCQMNERDSEAVAAQLVAKGYSLAKSEKTADVVLLNTCSVRDFAEQKAIEQNAKPRRRRAQRIARPLCSVSWVAWRKVADRN